MENPEILDEFQHSNGAEDGLEISADMQNDLATAAKWGKILAIIGFVLVGIGAIVGLLAIVSIASLSTFSEAAGMGSVMVLIWISMLVFFAVLALYVLPLVYLNRFASKMKAALEGGSVQNLAVSFENLGRLFKFLGILTLAIIAVYMVLYIAMLVVSVSAIGAL